MMRAPWVREHVQRIELGFGSVQVLELRSPEGLVVRPIPESDKHVTVEG